MVAPKVATPDQIIVKCNNLRRKWTTRHKKFVDWYKMLLLTDELKQEGMESVTANDPRTGFNLALHFLTSSIIAHRISAERLDAAQIAGTSYLENYFTEHWTEIEAIYRGSGRQSWLRDLTSLMLALGWFSVFAMADENGLVAEVWHPDSVYPDYGEGMMVECAHIYPLSAAAANKKLKTMGWGVTSPFTAPTILYDHWVFDADGDVANAIIMGRQFVKTPVKEKKLDRIPIWTSPVGGLPDRGNLAEAGVWQEHYGEGILATNEDITLNYNKMITYLQQLMRDTANPRWFEQSRGDTPILRDEDIFKRGAIFRGTPEENISILPTAPIPVELRTMLFDYQNMIQRGLFPWAVYGNIQQSISSIAMANIASASMQVLTPYYLAIKGLLSDIDNFWLGQMKKYGYKPNGFIMPEDIPDDVKFQVDFSIDIPGFLIQRATTARMLDPNFRLSTATTMEKLFPEIKDSLREMAKARRDDALGHPKALTIDNITAFLEEARRLREAGDAKGAQLYEKAAKSMEAELAAPSVPTGAAATERPVRVGRETMPEEVMEPGKGMLEL